MRRLAGDDPEVNEEWITDKDRFAFAYGRGDDRLTRPLVREDGVLRPASWPEALDVAAEGLREGRPGTRGEQVGVLTGGRLTLEDAYAYSKFARGVLGTNTIDFRSRPHSARGGRLPGRRRGRARAAASRTPTSRPRRRCCSSASSPRRRPARSSCGCARRGASSGLASCDARAVPEPRRGQGRHRRSSRPCPGAEAAWLDGWNASTGVTLDAGSVILVGERAAGAVRDAERRPPAGRAHRRPRRLGAAPGRRPRCGRGRLPAEPAARRPSGRRPVRPRRRRVDLGHRLDAAHRGLRRRRDAGRRRGRRPRRAGRGRGRPDRPRRPGRRARGPRAGRLRRQPRDPRLAGHRAGRRRPAGLADGRARRHVRQTGRAGAARSPRCSRARTRCPTCGCWPRWPTPSASRSASASPAAALAELDELGPWEGTPAPTPHFGAGRAGRARARRAGAGHLADGPRRQPRAGQRALPGRDGPTGGRPAQPGDGGRVRRATPARTA